MIFTFIILFSVICYLTTFVLEDLGLQSFSNIVKSLDIKKMHTVRKSISDVKQQSKSAVWCAVC